MYQLTRTDSVIRVCDSIIIPADKENTDRQAYEEWLSTGNAPLPPAKDNEEQPSSLERAWRDAELLKADIEVNKAADTASDTEKAWRKYRQALRDWPQSVAFPDSSARPDRPN